MEFKRKWVPAHTDYTLTLVKPSGKRLTHFLPYVWSTREEAQAVADKKNAQRDTAKYGHLVVEATEREGGWALEGFLPL